MDNYKKLSEELLKLDNIDPSSIPETERAIFKAMLDKEMKHHNQLSWEITGFMWIFALSMLGLCMSEQLLEKLHIPFVAAALFLMAGVFIAIFLLWPKHYNQIKESSEKVHKLHFLAHGKYRGVPLVGKKNGKRYIDWIGIILLVVTLWMFMAIGGAGVVYLLSWRWIYSGPLPFYFIFLCTIGSLSFVGGMLCRGLKAPLEELTEIKPENYTCSRRKFSLINLAIILTATLIIIYLFVLPQKNNEMNNHSSFSSLGQLTLAQQIARAPLIVRAVLENCNETSTRWRITKVLHGKITDDFVDIRYFPVSTEPEKSPESMQSWWHRIEKSKGKTLNAEEIWKEFSEIHSFWPTMGKEVILFLEKQDDKLYRYQGANYDVPPEHSLDKQEILIQQVIDSGAYKTAPPEDGRL